MGRGSGIDTIVDDGPLVDLQLGGIGDEGQGEGIPLDPLGGLWRQAARDNEARLALPLDAELLEVKRLGEGGEGDLAGLPFQLVGTARQIPEALALKVGLRQSNGQRGEPGDVVDKPNLGDCALCCLPQDDGPLQTERDGPLNLSGQSRQRECARQLPLDLLRHSGPVEGLPIEGLEDLRDLNLGDRRRESSRLRRLIEGQVQLEAARRAQSPLRDAKSLSRQDNPAGDCAEPCRTQPDLLHRQIPTQDRRAKVPVQLPSEAGVPLQGRTILLDQRRERSECAGDGEQLLRSSGGEGQGEIRLSP